MERGETLEEAGEPAQWVAFVERGSFKYMVHNDEEGKNYCTGFAFEGEFVADFPYCLDGDAAPVTIRADKPCTVYVVDGQQPNQHFLQSKKAAQVALQFLNYRFAQLHQYRRQYYFTHQPEDE